MQVVSPPPVPAPPCPHPRVRTPLSAPPCPHPDRIRRTLNSASARCGAQEIFAKLTAKKQELDSLMTAKAELERRLLAEEEEEDKEEDDEEDYEEEEEEPQGMQVRAGRNTHRTGRVYRHSDTDSAPRDF